MNPFPTFWHNFQISNKLSFWDILVYVLSLRCISVFFMLLCSIRHFWLRSSCIQEISFSIQERWILSQHSDTIFRSPTSLASEIYTFVSCHYDVFCVFFHVIVLDSSFLTAFQLYTRKILHYARKMNPLPTFWHNFQISNKLIFWDILVYVLSLRCICVFFHVIVLDSSFLTAFQLYTRKILHYTRKMNPLPTLWHNFQISNKLSFWYIHVYVLSLRCILCVFSCYCARFVIFDCVPVVYKKNPSLYKKDESFTNIMT